MFPQNVPTRGKLMLSPSYTCQRYTSIRTGTKQSHSIITNLVLSYSRTLCINNVVLSLVHTSNIHIEASCTSTEVMIRMDIISCELLQRNRTEQCRWSVSNERKVKGFSTLTRSKRQEEELSRSKVSKVRLTALLTGISMVHRQSILGS